MVKKAKTSPAKRKTVKAKPAAPKPAPARKAKPAPARKKTVKKKLKRPNALKRLENALMTGAEEVDELALSLGLLGAVEPSAKKRRKPRR